MANGFQGKEGQSVPNMNDEFVNSVSERYIELFEKVSGRSFSKSNVNDPLLRIKENIIDFLQKN